MSMSVIISRPMGHRSPRCWMNWYRPPGPSAPPGGRPHHLRERPGQALHSGEGYPPWRACTPASSRRRVQADAPPQPSPAAFCCPAITPNEAIAQCGDLQQARNGNGPKSVEGMLRGTMGGLELSELTVFWNFIDSILKNYCQTQSSESRPPG